MSIMAGKRQIPETLFDDLGFRMTYEAERVIYEAQTEHQHLVLFEHSFFGKILQRWVVRLDGQWKAAPWYLVVSERDSMDRAANSLQ